MKKNPGRKERRRLSRLGKRAEGRKKMRMNEWQDKKDKQLTNQL
ncbi:MAG: hypothetical protein WCS33_00035 [Candidatus Caldatribacteriota bacterium]